MGKWLFWPRESINRSKNRFPGKGEMKGNGVSSFSLSWVQHIGGENACTDGRSAPTVRLLLNSPSQQSDPFAEMQHQNFHFQKRALILHRALNRNTVSLFLYRTALQELECRPQRQDLRLIMWTFHTPKSHKFIANRLFQGNQSTMNQSKEPPVGCEMGLLAAPSPSLESEEVCCCRGAAPPAPAFARLISDGRDSVLLALSHSICRI